MQRPFLLSSLPSLLLLSLLLLSSFHGMLVTAQQVFNFPTGKIDAGSLTSLQHGSVDSSGSLTLDSSAGDARAFYRQPISLLDRAGVLSFSSFFTYASNATTGNGTIALAFTPNATADLAEARKTLTVEFNTGCSTGAYDGDGDGGPFYGGHGYGGRYGGGYGGGGRFGGRGGFGVSEYANNASVPPESSGGYGPGWTGQPPPGPYSFCNQNLSDPTFQFLIAIEYNASTDTVSVGSPSCGSAIALTTQFAAQNLSGIITNSVYVGFFVSGGGAYSISQWNFTSNTNTSSVANLAVSNIVSSTPSSDSSDGGNDGRRHSNGGLSKGFIVAFSVLGAAIGVAAVLLVCCLCARRRRVTSARFVAKSRHEGTIPESAVVFDAKKPNAPPAKVVLVERDTMPLNTHPNSASNGSTGAASWLQPVQPR